MGRSSVLGRSLRAALAARAAQRHSAFDQCLVASVSRFSSGASSPPLLLARQLKHHKPRPLLLFAAEIHRKSLLLILGVTSLSTLKSSVPVIRPAASSLLIRSRQRRCLMPSHRITEPQIRAERRIADGGLQVRQRAEAGLVGKAKQQADSCQRAINRR